MSDREKQETRAGQRRTRGRKTTGLMREESMRDRLAEAAGLALGLEEAEDVILTDCAERC